MPEVALAWVTARPGVSSTILGACTTDQLETNMLAAWLQLSPSETAALDAAATRTRPTSRTASSACTSASGPCRTATELSPLSEMSARAVG
jgi:diketogulonate reductase-like aldo/keto reductase